MVFSMAACGKSVSLSGSGTEADPYLIRTAEELRQMAKLMNNKDTCDDYLKAHFRLEADIDLDGKEWDPIGNYLAFEGVFDGNGHTVSGIKIQYTTPLTGTPQSYFGLFSQAIRGAVIKNVTISDSAISVKSSGTANVGAVIGRISGASVENCHATATVSVSGPGSTGGIVGMSYTDGAISGCTSAATITGIGDSASAGGIVGHTTSPVVSCTNSGSVTSEDAAGGIAAVGTSMTDCVNTGTIHAVDQAGGIVAAFGDGALNKESSDATVSLLRCVNSGDVTSEERAAGGIAAGAATGRIEDCTNSGTVTCMDGEAGGILGYFLTSAFGVPCEEFTIQGCENSGKVSAPTKSGNAPAGGILGMFYRCSARLVITDCRNTGSVTVDGQKDVGDSRGEAGGIAGAVMSNGITIRSCENTAPVSGVAASGGILGSASPSEKEAASSLVMENCRNTGSVFTSYHGGTTTMCYVGGMLGEMSFADSPEGSFTTVQFAGCENTGDLSCDKEPYASAPLCASHPDLA